MLQIKWLFLAAIVVSVAACSPTPDPEPVPTVEPQVLSCNISSPITLSDINPAGVDYIVECAVFGAKSITIEPGTTILMRSGGGFNMSVNALIVANGTAEKPITIKGEQSVAGYWKSILLASGTNGNVFNYCNISDGGGGSVNGDATLNGNIVISNATAASITHCKLERSGASGLYSKGSTTVTKQLLAFNNNQINSSVGAPISTIPQNVTMFDNTTTFANNGSNYVEIRLGETSGSNTWRNLSLPYYCTGLVMVGGTATDNITIEAGTTVDFGTDSGIMTKLLATSYIRMDGTAANPITLRGKPAMQGAWRGLCFQSLNLLNAMNYVNISDGGGGAFTGNATVLGNIVLGANAAGRCAISNTNSTNSAGCGLRLSSQTANVYADGGGNTFTGNAGGGVCP